MKTKHILSAILLTASLAAFAQTPAPHTFDFAVPNSKGDTIYYLITSPQTVAVSFRCDSVSTIIKGDHYLSWGKLPPRNLYQGNLVVPDKVTWQSVEYRVTAVAAFAFWNTSVESVSLPADIDSIGNYNFTACSGLKKLTLPDSVRYIGDRCFQSADLEEVHLGDLVSHLGEGAFSGSAIRRFVCPPLVKKIEQCCGSCQNLSEVILPEGLDTIIYGFNSGTPSLKYIRFPSTLVHVSGFGQNSGLREVVFPASVRTVSGFSGCPYLSSVEFLGGTDSISAFGTSDTSLLFLDLSPTRMRVWTKNSLYNEKMRSIILPQSLKKINRSATGFLGGQGISEITNISLVLPEKVDSIHVNAWVNFPAYHEHVKGELVLKSVGPPTIYDEFKLKNDTINYKPYSNIQVYVPCGSLEVYKSDPWWRYFYPNIREVDMEETWVDSLCEYQVQAKYGFLPDKSGVYNVVRPAADSLHCDTLSIYYINLYKAKINDTSINVYDDGTAFEWTWEGEGEEYEVLRNGDFVTMVKEPYYRDTAVETGVQYCYNFIPYLNGCRGETSMTNCYTRVQDDSSSVKTIQKHMLSLYPNPAKKSLFLTTGERYDDQPYEVTDVTGRIVLQGRYSAAEGIRVSGLAKGIYLLRLENRYGRFVKE